VVEGGGGLVTDDEARLVDECSGKCDALLLAAGEGAGIVVCAAGHAEAIEDLFGAFDGGGAIDPSGEEWNGGVFCGGEGWEKIVLLEDETEVLPPKEDLVSARHFGELLAEDGDFAFGWIEEASDDGDEGGFATATGANEEGHLAAVGLEVDAAKDIDFGVTSAEGFSDAMARDGG
jgi:hypothetical protein